MKYIDIRLEFDEVVEDDGYTYYNFVRVRNVGGDVPEEAREGIAESLAQSDLLYVEFANAIPNVIEGSVEEF